jgi:hypothetical protein
MHTACEESLLWLKKEVKDGNTSQGKDIEDRTFELEYITKSLNFCKKNISNEQYDLLNDFANVQYYFKHRNINKHTRLDSSFWAKNLDDNNISWSLQNLVSDITDTYENKDKYLSTHFKAHGINIGTLENRAKELVDSYIKELESVSLNTLLKSFDETLPDIRFAIKQSNYDAPSQINEIKNTYEEITSILKEKYSVADLYSFFKVVLVDKNDNEIEMKVDDYLESQEKNCDKKSQNKIHKNRV